MTLKKTMQNGATQMRKKAVTMIDLMVTDLSSLVKIEEIKRRLRIKDKGENKKKNNGSNLLQKDIHS